MLLDFIALLSRFLINSPLKALLSDVFWDSQHMMTKKIAVTCATDLQNILKARNFEIVLMAIAFLCFCASVTHFQNDHL